MSLNCAYHPSEGMKVVEDDEYKNLLSTGIWFDNPKSAWEYKYLFMSEYYEWPIIEGAHFLAGENPDKPPHDTEKYKSIIKAIEDDFMRGKLHLKERTNFKGDKIYFALNGDLIKWAADRGFDIPKCCDNYKQSKQEPQPNTPSALGKKGASVSNKKHQDAKLKAQAIAAPAWKKTANKTKEDMAALVQAEFQKEEIFNNDEPYSTATICEWIKEVMPNNKRKGGRPKKIKLNT
jgi:hypothetical protein